MTDSDTRTLDLTDQQRARAMRNAIGTQTCGVLGMHAFQSGVLLLYFTAALGISNELALVYLALPNFLSMIARLPVAHWADRMGKRWFGLIGTTLCAIGFAGIAVSGFWLDWAEWIILVGIVIFSAGKMLFAVTWLALLSDIVPEDQRGRFFGKIRICIQLAGIAFAALGAWLLTQDSPISTFQILLGLVVLGLTLRVVFYSRLPESPRSEREAKDPFWPSLVRVLRADGYASFCAYVFLLTLFTAGLNNLFALVEKDALVLSPGTIVLLANLTMIGGVAGQFLGGRAIDRIGTKYVFLVCHFSFGALMTAYLMRGALPVPLVVVLGGVHFLTGVVAASSGLAVTTEMLALIPGEHKSLSTSVCMSLILGGNAASGFVSAWVLKLDVLRDSWTLWGMTLSRYDTLILACAGMIILLVVTLGLVPSVIRKAEWFPRGQ